MEHVSWEGSAPRLRSPILVCAFAGWNDAASAATTAIEAIAAGFDSRIVARIDPEEFYDFQVNRPTIRLLEGQARHIDWPSNTLVAAPTGSAEHDFVLLSGVEPNLRWRTFADTILGVAEQLGVELLISLGALIADVAHTRPVPVSALASEPGMLAQLGAELSTYEGPTGIVGVLHERAHKRGLPSVSLWAAIPHYVAAVPNPKAALALLRRLEGITGVALEAGELEDAMERFEQQVDRAVAANPEIEELVQRLEAEQPAHDFQPGEEVPSGDALARAFQRYLQQRGDEPPSDA